MTDERVSLKELDDIPDPAAHLAARPPPEVAAPVEPSLTRPARERRSLGALAAGLAWLLVAAWILGFRDDLRSPDVAVPLLLWLVLLGAGLVLALRRRARGLPAGLRTVQAVALAALLGFVAAALATSATTGAPLPLEAHFLCASLSLGVALVPLALAAFALHRAFLSAPAWRGAAVGALCGLGGTIALHAHCDLNEVLHVTLTHGASIAAGALLGAAAGAWRGRA